MARRRKPRGLTAEEQDLWRQVAVTARRLAPAKRTGGDKPAAAAPASREDPATRSAKAPVAATPAPRRAAPTPRTTVARAPDPAAVFAETAGLDRRTAQRLKQGRRTPDARLDLHGMTAARAHAALTGFILRSQAEGLRCVLVITGKGGRGRPDPTAAPYLAEGAGVLRSMAPRWLALPPLRALVVGVQPAHRRHGGEGALYVYLKKPR